MNAGNQAVSETWMPPDDLFSIVYSIDEDSVEIKGT